MLSEQENFLSILSEGWEDMGKWSLCIASPAVELGALRNRVHPPCLRGLEKEVPGLSSRWPHDQGLITLLMATVNRGSCPVSASSDLP